MALPPALSPSRPLRRATPIFALGVGVGLGVVALPIGAQTRPPVARTPASTSTSAVTPSAASQDELKAQVRTLSEQVERLTTELNRLRERADQLDDRTDALATQQESRGVVVAPVPGPTPGGATAGAAAKGGAGGTGSGATTGATTGAATASGRAAPGAGSSGTGAASGTGTGSAAATAPASGDGLATTSGYRDPRDRSMAASGLVPDTLDSSVGRASLFGYGELNYNRYTRDTSQSRATVRRAVLGFGYRFTDRLRLVSEYEWENAVVSADDPGESEVEQLYLDYAIDRRINIKAGLFLIPIGILNEMHEPTYYYGVERNDVETRVIPTTWREIGVGVYGRFDNGLYYDVGVTTGFNMAKWNATEGSAAPLAAIHGEGAQAYAGSGALYAALRYNVPGLRIGGGIWSGDSAQRNGMFKAGESTIDLAGINGRVTLWDIHAIWQPGKWDFRALYTRGTIGNAGRIDNVLAGPAVGQTGGFVPASIDGWYVQGAYALWRDGDFDLRPFARYERYDLQRQMPAGFGSFIDPLLKDRAVTVGLNFFVTRNAVVKADYQRYQRDRDRNRINLGLGFAF